MFLDWLPFTKLHRAQESAFEQRAVLKTRRVVFDTRGKEYQLQTANQSPPYFNSI